MYLNNAAMDEVTRIMKCHHFKHYNEGGMIVVSVGANKNGSEASIAFTQKHDGAWNVYVRRDLVGKINLPHYYWTQHVAAYFDAVCWAVYEDRKDKVEQMINPPLDSLMGGYGRLAAMSYVPQYDVSWDADSDSDTFGLVWRRVGGEGGEAPSFNFTPNYPEEGKAQFVVLDKFGNELNFALFDWMYGNDDVVAYMQTAQALITFCDPRLTEGAQIAIEKLEVE